MIFGTNEVVAVNSGGDSAKASGSLSVKLEVRSSLGISLDGKVVSDEHAIRIGGPDSGIVSYVILDGL